MRFAVAALMVMVLAVMAGLGALGWMGFQNFERQDERLNAYLEEATRQRQAQAERRQAALDADIQDLKAQLDALGGLDRQRRESLQAFAQQLQDVRQQARTANERAEQLQRDIEAREPPPAYDPSLDRQRMLLLRLESLLALAADVSGSGAGAAAGAPLLLAIAELARHLPLAWGRRLEEALRRDLQAWEGYEASRRELAALLDGLASSLEAVFRERELALEARQVHPEEEGEAWWRAPLARAVRHGRRLGRELLSVRRLDGGERIWHPDDLRTARFALSAHATLARTALASQDPQLWGRARDDLVALAHRLGPLTAQAQAAAEALAARELPAPPPPPAHTENLVRALGGELSSQGRDSSTEGAARP